ncbi:MAG: hypothetical protein ICV51_19045 [Flavisolibacter sp.]|nr:hypothetical protein [Flavisolibacter sp.]
MRSADDLQRITPLMWRELTTLKIPFVRCGVFIVDEALKSVHLYLSTPEGRPLSVLHLPIDETEQSLRLVNYWRKGIVYTEHWSKEQFLNWMQTMIDSGQVHSREAYLGDPNPPESLHLHFVPFAQGMLYVGNTAPLNEEEIGLVKSLAEAFAIAYARYDDFKHLEEAKNQVDATLAELKSAQTQLIHSEKMASLGELTAGIAHEIQNPLNFVNNFSEVNAELIEELKQKVKSGDLEEVLLMADNIKGNELKINHHGKRADTIVKGMLQHSRKSTGQKEPTDLNALMDEYVRLSYHGMRAKDKSFSTIVETHFDESIGKIDVVPQDIGRAILNLLNNAFYAVQQKKQQLNGNYQPAVSICTKKIKDSIEISVKDNGLGIPQKVVDKIFQPFFTTKPTGEGTGLGLSLSYDIITNGHSGELSVNTEEGEGSEFIVRLPAC